MLGRFCIGIAAGALTQCVRSVTLTFGVSIVFGEAFVMGRFRWRAIAALILLSIGMVAKAETLEILGDDAYTPVIFSSNGKPDGVLARILARVEILTGDHYDIRLAPWKRTYELALRGEGGVIGLSMTEERSNLFDYSTAIYDDNIQVVTLKSRQFRFSKLDDLKGKVIGGVNGASYGDEVDRAIESGLFTMDRDVSQAGRLRKLLAGRLDAAFIGNGQAGFEAVLSGVDELMAHRNDFAILPRPLTRDPLHLAFAKSLGKREALERFDAAIEKMRKSGELKSIISSALK